MLGKVSAHFISSGRFAWKAFEWGGGLERWIVNNETVIVIAVAVKYGRSLALTPSLNNGALQVFDVFYQCD